MLTDRALPRSLARAPLATAMLLGVLLLTVLTGCAPDPRSTAARETARQALDAILTRNPETVAQNADALVPFLAPADRWPDRVAGEVSFSPAGLLPLLRCKGVEVSFRDRAVSDPPGARLVTAKFQRACIPDQPRREKDTLGMLMVDIDGRWYLAQLQ